MHFQKRDHTNFWNPSQNSKAVDRQNQQQFLIKKLSDLVVQKKEVILYKIKNGLQANSQNQNLDDSVFSNEESESFASQNTLSIYLGDYEIFQNFYLSDQPLQLLASITMKDYDVCMSEVQVGWKGSFNQQFDFPIVINKEFLNTCINEHFILEVFTQNNQEKQSILRKPISMKEFLEENQIIGRPSKVWKNKEIIYRNDKDVAGYVFVHLKFKNSPALNIALV